MEVMGKLVFDLKGFSTVDVDTEEDFILAEIIAKSKDLEAEVPKYFNSESIEISDAQVERILKQDGVKNNNQENFNLEKVSINKLIEKYGREKIHGPTQ